MRFWTISILGLSLALVSACSSKKESVKSSTEAKALFLADFAEKDHKVSDPSTLLFSDGKLRYFMKVNEQCLLKFEGKVESVALFEDRYSVKYRYNVMKPEVIPCTTSQRTCSLDITDCRRVIGIYERTVGRSQGIGFKKGDDPSHIYRMLPPI